MSTIAIKNQTVCADMKADRKLTLKERIRNYVLENAEIIEVYACSLSGRTYIPYNK